MGWFSKATKALRPDKLLKDPKKSWQLAHDPAGTIVRSGRGDMPNNMRSFVDPGGFFDGRDPTNYAPYQSRPMQLSPKAQALYDQMKARTAQREAAKAQAQAPQQQAAQGVVNTMINDPRFRGRVMADGGQVREEECEGHSTLTNKIINRKPNGKPY